MSLPGLLMILNVVLPSAHKAAVEPFLQQPVDSMFITPILKNPLAPRALGQTLVEEDYVEVARELGVEVAAIKAVVEIEAGKAHKGFAAPGQPIINFDLTMFRQAAARRGIDLSKYNRTHPAVFTRVNALDQKGVWNRFKTAQTINPHAAIEGCFWGMFQIGGFNYKLTGNKSHEEFVEQMSRSERDQLEMFARFITNTGMLKDLRDKNWASFSRKYNGNSYAQRGYHTRMAAAYKKYSSR